MTGEVFGYRQQAAILETGDVRHSVLDDHWHLVAKRPVAYPWATSDVENGGEVHIKSERHHVAGMARKEIAKLVGIESRRHLAGGRQPAQNVAQPLNPAALLVDCNERTDRGQGLDLANSLLERGIGCSHDNPAADSARGDEFGDGVEAIPGHTGHQRLTDLIIGIETTHAHKVWIDGTPRVGFGDQVRVGYNAGQRAGRPSRVGDPAGEMPKGFFEHSIGSAAGAAVVARQVGVRASDAFSAALLHDVGSPLLYRAARPRWEEAIVEDDEGNVHLDLNAERAVFGSSHDQLGAQVMEYLHFPPSIIDVVASHNNPSALVTSRLTRIVIAGIALAEAAGNTSTTEPIVDPVDAFEAVELSFPPSDKMLEELEDEIADLRSVLS